jgi:hypothetical protein
MYEMPDALTLDAFSGAFRLNRFGWICRLDLIVAIATIHILILIVDVMGDNLPSIVGMGFDGLRDLGQIVFDTLRAHAFPVIHEVEDRIPTGPGVGDDRRG